MGHKVPGEGKGLNYLLFQQKKNHKLPSEEKWADNAGVGHSELKWCSMDCEHADWPRENVDGSKSCRTFSAIWCKVLEGHVTKNTPCSVEHGSRRPKPNW